jgi:ribose transport system substrate-binding protein
VAPANKKVFFVAGDMKNTAIGVWGQTLQKIAPQIGWEVSIVDGQGVMASQQSGILQAIAQKPDGIILGAMPDAFRPYFRRASDAGIPVVGMHSAPTSGAFPEFGVFWNVAQKVDEAGKALADWIIVKSGGKARVVLTADSAYAVTMAKAAGIREELKTCKECTILLDTQVPFADANSRAPQLITSWLNQYGSGGPFYVAQPADYFTDFQIPALRAAGAKAGDVILTGFDAASPIYDRIRGGDPYHLVSLPLPYEMQAYQAIDELNRAFAGEQPFDLSAPVYVIDHDNVDTSGGDKNTYIPANNYAEHFIELWKTGSTK